MTNSNQEGSQERLPCISAPIFTKYDGIDRIFAVIYLAVGYGFIYTFSSIGFEKNIAVFTAFYTAIVLVYLLGKGIRPAKESWFWLAVLLAIGIPYALWSSLYVFQILALMIVAAYWTLSASGRLLDEKKTSGWVFFDMCNSIAVVPFCNFLCQIKALFGSCRIEDENKEKSTGATGRAVLLGMVIAVPVLLIILPLLSSADAGFEYLVGNAAAFIEEHLLSILLRLLFALPVSAYLYGLVFGGINGRNTEKFQIIKLQETAKQVRCVPDAAVCTALAILCMVYVLFIGLQGTYLFSAFTGNIPHNFTYAEYARRGFFELCQIGLWNLVILRSAGMFSKTERREHRVLSLLTVLLSVLTLFLIATAVSKLGMYISVYGLTVNRVIPMVFLIWMALVFVCVILNQKYEIRTVRICVMAGAVLFCLLCIFPIESWCESYNYWARFHGYIM